MFFCTNSVMHNSHKNTPASIKGIDEFGGIRFRWIGNLDLFPFLVIGAKIFFYFIVVVPLQCPFQLNSNYL